MTNRRRLLPFFVPLLLAGLACAGGDAQSAADSTSDDDALCACVDLGPDFLPDLALADDASPIPEVLDVAEIAAETSDSAPAETFACGPNACCPNCTGRECGSDGCAGLCGTCDNPAKPLCGPAGTCVEGAPLPTSWPAVGVVATLETPSDALIASTCADHDGDGKGDSALKTLAPTVNPELAKALADGSLTVLMQFQGVTGFTTSGPFGLAFLWGRPAAPADGFLVDPAAYSPYADKDGAALPWVSLPAATLASGALSAGLSTLSFNLPDAALGITLHVLLEDVRVSATTVTGGPDGVTATGGVATAVLRKGVVDAWSAQIKALCELPDPPPAAYCNYRQLFASPSLYDLDLDGDGKKDAASLCFLFTLTPAAVVGLVPAQ